MYPDTDLPPKRIAGERLERIRRNLPAYYWTREAWCRTLGVPEDVVRPLAISPQWDLFEKVVREWGLPPVLVAVALVQLPKRLKRKRLSTAQLTTADFEGILAAHRSGRLAREGILPALARAAEAARFEPGQLPPPLPADGVETAISRGLARVKELAVPTAGQRFRAAMALVMRELDGRAPGAGVAGRLAARLQEDIHER